MIGTSRYVLLWAATRAISAWLLFGPEWESHGDVAYYQRGANAIGHHGVETVMPEYPVLLAFFSAVPWYLAELTGDVVSFPAMLLGLGLLLDAVFTYLLRRRGEARGPASTYWLYAVPVLGSIVYARLDLVPGLLAAIGVLVLRRPRMAAILFTIAAALKLWPAVIIPGLLAPSSERRIVVKSALLLALTLLITTWLFVGTERLLSPLMWQTARGLQIESVAATPFLLLWAAGFDDYRVYYSNYLAFEIAGPGISEAASLTELATSLVIVFLCLCWWRVWRGRGASFEDGAVWLALTAVLGLVVTSKVLSPQYFVWLLPMVAAGISVTSRESRQKLQRWGGFLLAAAAMTHLIFPYGYGTLVADSLGTPYFACLLALRNILLIWLMITSGKILGVLSNSTVVAGTPR